MKKIIVLLIIMLEIVFSFTNEKSYTVSLNKYNTENDEISQQLKIDNVVNIKIPNLYLSNESIVEVDDGFVVVGGTKSSYYDNYDSIIIKLDTNGNVVWKKTWGGDSDDLFLGVAEDEDGYVVVGYSSSGNIEGLNIDFADDAIIIKYDKSGNVVWQKNWGGRDNDSFNSIILVDDGYVVVGDCYVTSNLVSNGLTKYGDFDAVIVKYDKNGNVVWQKNWGGNEFDSYYSIQKNDDDYIVTGVSSSDNIEGIDYKGQEDAIIVKYDKNGNIIWQKNWGGNDYDIIRTVISVSDGFVAVGDYSSTDINDLSVNSYDGMILKYDKNGNIIWQKSWGGNNSDWLESIVDVDEGYIAVGRSSSSNIEGLNSIGNFDAILIKFDKNGNVLMQQNYGSVFDDDFSKIFKKGNDYVAFGNSYDENHNNILIIVKYIGDKEENNNSNNSNNNNENNVSDNLNNDIEDDISNNNLINENKADNFTGNSNNTKNIINNNSDNVNDENNDNIVDVPNTLKFISNVFLIIGSILIIISSVILCGFIYKNIKKNNQ